MAADQQFRRVRHCAEIGPDIDRVGDEQQRHDQSQKPARIVPAQVSSDAVSGRAADARADVLDRDHQRIGEQHGPADAEAELCACLAIGADSGRIVIGSARDQARPEHVEKAPKRALFLRSGIGHVAGPDRSFMVGRTPPTSRFVTDCGSFQRATQWGPAPTN
jgi:hypothetical protein